MFWTQTQRIISKTIKQEIEFESPPHEIYEAYMDSEKHAKFSGQKANISRVAGGSYSAYDGHISGYNIKLVKDERIIQYWIAKTKGWPKGHLSRVEFVFKKHGSGTQLKFTHSSVPEELCSSIEMGWHKHYWEPMKKMLNS